MGPQFGRFSHGMRQPNYNMQRPPWGYPMTSSNRLTAPSATRPPAKTIPAWIRSALVEIQERKEKRKKMKDQPPEEVKEDQEEDEESDQELPQKESLPEEDEEQEELSAEEQQEIKVHSINS